MFYLLIILSIEVAVLVPFMIIGNRKYGNFAKQYAADFQLIFLAPVSLYIIDRTKLIDRHFPFVQGIHSRIIKLYGAKNVLAYTKMYLAQIISAIIITILMATIFSLLLDGDMMIFIYGLVFTPFLVYLLIKDLDKKLKKRQQQIIWELPEFLNMIVLFVNAGETLPKTLIRIDEQRKNSEKSPLYTELSQTVNELKLNHPFQQVMEGFSKRCGVQEVSILTTTILLNYRKGGGELVIALRELSTSLWEKRKSVARSLGEEASSKLVFPMVLIFVVVMIIVAAPAIMFMN